MTTASITITERAAERVAQIVCNEPDNKMFRISVEGGGCSGFAYRFDLVPTAEPQDAVIERAGARHASAPQMQTVVLCPSVQLTNPWQHFW